jgi:alpha-tubulin suppressor-like RCC1 family protein
MKIKVFFKILGFSVFSLFIIGPSQILLGQTGGAPWAWGSHQYGQLGNGVNLDRNVPVQVLNLTGVIAITGMAFCPTGNNAK